MQPRDLERLTRARHTDARDAFHRQVFELLVGGDFRQVEIELTPGDTAGLLDTLTRWVVESAWNDEFSQMRMLAARKPLRELVYACGVRPSDFLLGVLSVDDLDLDDPLRLPAWKRVKLAMLGDANLWTPGVLDRWGRVEPVPCHVAAITSLDTPPLDESTERRASDLGAWLARHRPVDMPGRHLSLIQHAAFSVSYLACPRRHEFKRALVLQAAHMLRGIAEAIRQASRRPGQTGDRPRLTVVGEMLFPAHAMFRCYADVLLELKAHFHVTLVADQPTRCARHLDISHEQVYFPAHELDVARLAAIVRKTHPDIIVYPSIGMTYWTFTLSLLRLAPLQLMSVGHPAPVCSEHIDGTLLFEKLALAPLPEHPPLIPFGRQSLPLIPIPARSVRAPGERRPPVLAVNAAGMKLSPGFLATVARILAAAPPGAELHFFPNYTGCELAALRRELGQRFPQAHIHATAEYRAYVEALSRADVILQSFPFGGTNTVMDALALGIPMVCLRGDDLSARVDPLLLEEAGLGDLCADSVDDYVNQAVSFVQDGAARLRFQQLAATALPRLSASASAGGSSLADAVLRRWQQL